MFIAPLETDSKLVTPLLPTAVCSIEKDKPFTSILLMVERDTRLLCCRRTEIHPVRPHCSRWRWIHPASPHCRRCKGIHPPRLKCWRWKRDTTRKSSRHADLRREGSLQLLHMKSMPLRIKSGIDSRSRHRQRHRHKNIYRKFFTSRLCRLHRNRWYEDWGRASSLGRASS